MAYWTVIGKGIEEPVAGKAFGITLDTAASTWQVSGPSVALFFSTRSGPFKFVALPENGAQLLTSQNAEAGFCTFLNGATAVGATGRGRATEKGVSFTWKLDSK